MLQPPAVATFPEASPQVATRVDDHKGGVVCLHYGVVGLVRGEGAGLHGVV